MAPKTITMWAWTLLHHGEQFKVVSVGHWEASIGVGFGRGVGFSTLYLSILRT